MQNHFNKANTHKTSIENKQREQNYFLNNKNDLNPNTLIIRKSKRNPNIINEKNDNNIKVNNYKEQTTQKINTSKKAKNTFKDSNKSIKNNDMNPKTLIIRRSNSKQLKDNKNNELKKSVKINNINNINNNNINNDNNLNFLKDENNEVNKYLKSKSVSKKKKNFLKESININALNFEEDANKIEENEVKKLIDKPNNNNNMLFKINEENSSEFNLKIKMKQKEAKEIEKNQNSKTSSNNKIVNINKTFKRSATKKNSEQGSDIFKKEKFLFSFVKKNSLRLSSKELGEFRNSIRDFSLSNSVNFGKGNKNSINNIIIPMLNRKKENNCFLNVIVQNLVHLPNFKNDLLLNESSDFFTRTKTVNEFYNLIKLYESEQIKNKYNIKENKNNKDFIIEPILSVNNLRNSLNEVFNRYKKGESGDPMETMNSIFDLIHESYCKKMKLDKNKIKSCKCLAHKHFLLKLADIQYCPNCNSKKVQMYDKDCFMYNIFINDIINKLHSKNLDIFKLKLFQKLKEHNENFEEKKKPKIPGCNCNEKLMESYVKTTKIMGPINTYLIINITWAEEFPSMNDILKTYALIPINNKIHNLFSFDEKSKYLINYTFSIKGFILFGIYHYVCALYIKEEKKWAVVDDKTIKFIDKYYNLIDSFLRNHLMPVGIIYSKDENDIIKESIVNNMIISKDEFKKLYQFCKDVDNRRGLKTSGIFDSRISFDEDKGDYINNNLFYSIFDGSNDTKKTQNLINSIIISDKKEDKKEEQNIKDIENKEKDKNKNKGGIFSFNKKFGNDLRGGIIDFSEDNKEIESSKENNNLDELGNIYEE